MYLLIEKKKKKPKYICSIFQWNFLLPFGIFTIVIHQKKFKSDFFFPIIFFFFWRKKSNLSLKTRPEGQTEQKKKWQEEQTPSKPLKEKKI